MKTVLYNVSTILQPKLLCPPFTKYYRPAHVMMCISAQVLVYLITHEQKFADNEQTTSVYEDIGVIANNTNTSINFQGE